MKRQLTAAILFGFAMFFSQYSTTYASMGDYCATPPFVTGSAKPNVLFILDNSGSMNEFAYHEVRGERCSYLMTAWTGYEPGKKYYGLFNPDKCYKYDNSKHYFYVSGDVVDDPSTPTIHERAACLASNCTTRCFSGNWLNWWTMRRIDVAKKVLTGGRLANDPNEYVLIGSPHDRDMRRIFNDYASTDTPTDGNVVPPNKNVYYTPFRRAIYSYFFTNDPSPRNGQFVPLFNVVVARFDSQSDITGGSCVDCYINASPDGDYDLLDDAVYGNLGETGKSFTSYYVAVKYGDVATSVPPHGIVQSIANQMRLGYMQFNYGLGPGDGYPLGGYAGSWDINGDGTADVVWRYGDGGRIRNYVGDTSVVTTSQGDNVTSIVQNINEQNIEMCTPLSEVLNEAMRYFKQDTPCYAPGEGGVDFSVNDTWDPYYFNDLNQKVKCAKSFIVLVTDGESNSNGGVNNCGDLNENFAGDGNGYLDDIAYKIHTRDLRSDLDGDQLIDLYTVFAFEDSDKAKNEMMRAARAGGFKDLDGDGEPYMDSTCSSTWGDGFCAGSCADGPGKCDPLCQEWDSDCDGVPDNFFEAQDGYKLEDQLSSLFADILKQASSGTSLGVSYSVNRTDRADGVIQAVFFPDKVFSGNYDVVWTGEVYKYSPKKVEKGFEKWKAGDLLKARSPSSRTIYVYDSNTTSLVGISSAFEDKICGTDLSCSAELNDIISFVKGNQVSGYRNITVDSDGHTWKLGDIIYSSPKVDYFSSRNKSYVFLGANDGMMHAFDYDTGNEVWAFIPTNALPYIKYLKERDYCHMYFVDAEPYIYTIYQTDASGNLDFDHPLKKILIGGMGFGGACGCSDCVHHTADECVTPPAETCADPTGTNCYGRSSYFALDVTDPLNPKLLWEFSDPDLGFAWSGPAIVRRKDSSGKWKYLVTFMSGPTSYNGYSCQNLRAFTFDLETGPSGGIYKKELHTAPGTSTNLQNAFAGRLYTEGLDVNDDNQTDYFFAGYCRKSGNSVSHGGVIKVYTGDTDPSKWVFDANFFNLSHTPVMAKVDFMKCFDKWYIFFGTGRYFYSGDNDSDTNHLYGIPFPCDENNICKPGSINSAHAATATVDCNNVGSFQANKGGWDIELQNDSQGLERCYSDPLLVDDQNLVYFFTGIPTNDVCSYGGITRIYGLNCATGESLNGTQQCENYQVEVPTKSKLLVPTSSGNVYDINPVQGLGTHELPGLPPPGGGGFLVPDAHGKFLLWIER